MVSSLEGALRVLASFLHLACKCRVYVALSFITTTMGEQCLLCLKAEDIDTTRQGRGVSHVTGEGAESPQTSLASMERTSAVQHKTFKRRRRMASTSQRSVFSREEAKNGRLYVVYP